MSGTNQDPLCREGNREGGSQEGVLGRKSASLLPGEPSLTRRKCFFADASRIPH